MSLRAIHQRLFPIPAGGLLGEPTRLNPDFIVVGLVLLLFLFLRLFVLVVWCRGIDGGEGEEVATAKVVRSSLICCLVFSIRE
jgi:hypothetical protein